MLRQENQDGWALITHRDHAMLAGEFAASWGNELISPPEPRQDVLKGISQHDDGWIRRDAAPQITRQGKPSAFSVELVGKYSAFEEIDLADYLEVRQRALEEMAMVNRYAAIVISMHTYDLLSERADRSTIAPSDLPTLDRFLVKQKARQEELKTQLRKEKAFSENHLRDEAFQRNFALLQACDSLSLMVCVDYPKPTGLQHALPTTKGTFSPVEMTPLSTGVFRLHPFPFAGAQKSFRIPYRQINQHHFNYASELQKKYAEAETRFKEIHLIA